jgi:hypothetical protein
MRTSNFKVSIMNIPRALSLAAILFSGAIFAQDSLPPPRVTQPAAPARFAFGIDMSHSISVPNIDLLLSDFTDFRLSCDGKAERFEYELGYSFQNGETKAGSGDLAQKSAITAHFLRAGLGVYWKRDTRLTTVYLGPKYVYQRILTKTEDDVGASRAEMNYHDFIAVAGLERRLVESLSLAGEFQGMAVYGSGDSRGFGDKQLKAWIVNNVGSIVLRWYFL